MGLGNVRVDVLDHGYVALVDHLGSDLTPVNAAKASFKKRSVELSAAETRLLDFLVSEGHTSPFRHAMVQFEICAPIMVARQLWRYTVGASQQDTLSAWNEASYRYISQEMEFYVPQNHLWRGAPDNKKQGSKGLVPIDIGTEATNRLVETTDQCLANYYWALSMGIAPEQARLFIPANGIYTSWYLTASMQAICHLLNERADTHAMYETQLYAGAIYHLVKQIFPGITMRLLEDDKLVPLTLRCAELELDQKYE